jgi:hypothetical protein
MRFKIYEEFEYEEFEKEYKPFFLIQLKYDRNGDIDVVIVDEVGKTKEILFTISPDSPGRIAKNISIAVHRDCNVVYL